MSSKAATWLPVKVTNLFSLFSSPGGASYPQYRYTGLQEAAEHEDDNMNPEADDVVVASGASRVATGVDAAMAKRVVRKIDMRLIPLLFITYMLNFMDKTILSSASVFGLQDDTVCTLINSSILPSSFIEPVH